MSPRLRFVACSKFRTGTRTNLGYVGAVPDFVKLCNIFVDKRTICGNIAKFSPSGSVMSASSSSLEFGKRLRAEREFLRLSLRQVQDLSRTLAEQRKNSEFYLAHSTLADIENGKQTPSIYKLYSLSVIYRRQYQRLATYFDVPVDEAEKDHSALEFPQTYLKRGLSDLDDRTTALLLEMREKLRFEPTNLASKIFEKWKEKPAGLLGQVDPRTFVYGYVGNEDYTLYPYIRPGSLVLINCRKRKIEPMDWLNEFERPIFFFELRDRYVCSWCELHGSQLILVPTAQSRKHTIHVRYPGDATIVGRVAGVSMIFAEVNENSS